MVTVKEVRKAQRVEGPTTVFAIGTATPPNCVDQATYPNYNFRITNSEHKVELKEKFQRMCDKSMIKKRYMYLTEEILKENPSVCEYMAPSPDARQDLVVVEVPRLGKEAATKAIKEWGHPNSPSSGPSPLLQAPHSVPTRLFCWRHGCPFGQRLGRKQQGCTCSFFVCSEITAVTFRGPSDTHLDSLVGQALFGDDIAVVIIGADPVPEVEKPLFELVSVVQTILPDSDGAIDGHLREVGLTFHLLKDVIRLILKNIEKSLIKAFKPIGIFYWNSLFWIAHPGSLAILDQVEAKLALKPEKLEATRQVLSDYGNMSSACVLFILDEVRRKSTEKGLKTTGEGLEWGVLFGFGPGLTIETVVLHNVVVACRLLRH
ncbi:hypothetical protein C1H46_040660 [Malus baccata]|uniref:Chalcone synthase n=1 Tax=Malus baccata TaxID=106549 RepID=A0A540KI00_MALBA|nr:hypothetical protein C1H46_040660 [Malus baccata]